jgi:hypothetical protein
MCRVCGDNEHKLYPDLGKGSMLQIKIHDTVVSADKTQGIRILQNRTVDYMGPEGVLSREETHCIYVGWPDVEEVMTMIIALQMKVENDGKED